MACFTKTICYTDFKKEKTSFKIWRVEKHLERDPQPKSLQKIKLDYSQIK